MLTKLAHRDSKVVLALVIVALLIAAVLLALTGHHVPDALNSALVAAVGSLAGVSLPAGAAAAAQRAENELSAAVQRDDRLDVLRRDVNEAIRLAHGAVALAGGYDTSPAAEQDASRGDLRRPQSTPQPGPLPDVEPAS